MFVFFLLVSPWQSGRGSESSHCSWLQAHRWGDGLPERDGGGRRGQRHDQRGRGQERRSFHSQQGKISLHAVCCLLQKYLDILLMLLIFKMLVSEICLLHSCGALSTRSPWCSKRARRRSLILNWTTSTFILSTGPWGAR